MILCLVLLQYCSIDLEEKFEYELIDGKQLNANKESFLVDFSRTEVDKKYCTRFNKPIALEKSKCVVSN